MRPLTWSRWVIGDMCPAPGTRWKAALGSAARSRLQISREGSLVLSPRMMSVGTSMAHTSAGPRNSAWKSITTLESCGAALVPFTPVQYSTKRP